MLMWVRRVWAAKTELLIRVLLKSLVKQRAYL
jgi:hypothetical protein